jgi:hypothetical protein
MSGKLFYVNFLNHRLGVLGIPRGYFYRADDVEEFLGSINFVARGCDD